MRTAEEWLEEMFSRGNWVAADTVTLRAIQHDALLEAAEIAARHIGQRSSDGRKILDAILARAEELNDLPRTKEG